MGSDRNAFSGNPDDNFAAVLADMQRRIERLELTDGLLREHPVTGSDDFLGTVLSTPSGEPMLVVSQQEGFEAPAQQGQLVSPGDIYQLSTPVDEWEIMYQVNFTGVIADAVEIDTLAQLESPTGTTYDFKLQVFTDAGNGAESPVYSFTSTSPFEFLDGTWRWKHGLDFDVSAKWGINILGMCDSLANTRFDMNKPRFATQRGSSMMGGTDPLNPFVVTP